MDLKSSSVDKDDVLQYDLGNLSAFDAAPIDTKEFGQNPRLFLEQLARDNTQLLVNHIFELPTEPEPSNQGRLAALPEPTTKIPRSKPVPKPKPLTKWEQFALTKGIEKRKRSRMVFDEDKEEYLPRHGFKRARKDEEQWPIVEAKPGEDASVDPWTRAEQDRKERIAKNKKQQQNNLKAAAGSNRVPGAIDLTSTVEMKQGKRNQEGKKKQKSHVDMALEVAQRSTASMGKFDKQRAREPEMKAPKKPRRDAELERSVEAEKKQSLAVLNRILGKAAEAEKFNVEKEMSIRQVFQESETRKSKEAKAAAKAGGSSKGGSSKGGSSKGGKGGKGSAKGSRGKR